MGRKYQRIEPSEVFTLPHPTMAWPLAAISLAFHDAGWTYGYRLHSMEQGEAGPLGYDSGPAFSLPDRAAALAAAVTYMRPRCSDPRQSAWLDTILPKSGDQMELF